MISPANIVVDVSGLPAPVQAVIASIDAQIGTWQPRERQKTVPVNLGALPGQLPVKQQALDRIVSGYRKMGWTVDYDRQTSTETVRVLVFELPD